jgi:hypothetical protein
MSGPWLYRWVTLCDATSIAGRPTSHVVTGTTGSGKVGTFEHGVLGWSAGTGVHVVSGPSAARYVAVGREGSPLGYPTTDTAATPNGSGQSTSFVNGAIVASAASGAWDVYGATYLYWSAAGATTSPLGFPTSAVTAAVAPGAQVTHFQNGDVYTSALGTFAVLAPIRPLYLQAGADGGTYGLPIADATGDGTTVVQEFQGGSITAPTG